MRSFRISQLLACVFTVCLGGVSAHANPIDGVVSDGQATITTNGTTLNINQSSDRAVIDWRSFNIDPGETTAFHQPSSSSITLNRINSADPSQILGTLTANGHVILINPNGVFFGKGSRVDVGGLTATTANIRNNDFMSSHMNFDQPGRDDASIVNEGSITVHDGGLVNLAGPNVENHGVITATLGKINMASGEKFTIDMANDGLIKVAVDKDSLPGQAIANTGTLSANGGQINMTAAAARDIVDSLISNTGVIEAKTIGDHKGSVTLSAEGSNAVARNITTNKKIKQGQSATVNSGTIDVSGLNAGESGGNISLLADNVWVEGGSKINASGAGGGGTVKIGGDFHGEGITPTASATYVAKNTSITADAIDQGDGGDVTIWADGSTDFYGDISAKGGAQSGNGGFVEVSGKDYLNYRGAVNTLAGNGEAGMLLLDPANLSILAGSGDAGGDGSATFKGNATVGTVIGVDALSTIYESELEGIASATNIALTATSGITIASLSDGNLNLAQTSGKTVTFSAGASGIVMANTSDTITTAGGALTFTTVATGGAITLGHLTTNGGNIAVTTTGASSIGNISTANGSANVNATNGVTINNASIGSGGLTITSTAASTVNGVISGVGGGLVKSGNGSLTLMSTNTYTGGSTLNAGAVILNTNGSLSTGTVTMQGAKLQGNGSALTIGAKLAIKADTTIQGSSDLTFTNQVVNVTTGHTLTVNNTGTTTFSNVISDGGASAALGLSVVTGATVALNGANTFVGAIGSNGGTFIIGNDSAFGVGGLMTLRNVTLCGNGNHTISNPGTITSSVTFDGTSDLTFTGAMGQSTSQTLTNSGTGLVTLGDISLSGSATSRNMTFTGTGNFLVNGVISNGASAASTIAMTGSGILTLTGANTYGGNTVVSSGMIRLGNDSALGGGTLMISNAAIEGNGVSHTLTNAVTMSGNTTISGASDIALNGAFALSNSAASNVLTISASGTTTLGGIVSNGGSSTAGAIVQSGTGTLVLRGTNAFAGGVIATSGIIQAGNDSAFGTGTIALNGGTLQGDGIARILANAVTLAANSSISGASDLTFNGALTNTGDLTLTNNNSGITNLGAIALSNTTTAHTLTFAGTGATSVAGVIDNGGGSTGGGIIKSGNGVMTLSGNNAYTGNTAVTAGTLKLGAADRIANASDISVSGGAKFDFNGFNETVHGITATGEVAFGTGNTVTTTSTQAYNGKITGGDVSLVSTGGNITATNAQNDITGDLALNASGSVNIVDVNALKLGAVSASTLTAFAKGGNLTLDGNIQTSGTSGTPLLLSTTGNFINSGSYTLQTGAGGRWLVYSTSPLSNSNGGLAAAFKQYNATYGDTVLGSGNGFVYTLAPIVTAGLTGTVTKAYDGTTAATLAASNYSVASAVDGDTVTFNNPASGIYDDANAGTGRTVTVSGISLSGATNGAATVYGYQLASSTASAAVGTIDRANLTVTTSDVTKVYDGTVTANGTPVISSGMLYTNASNGNIADSLTSGSYSFASPAIGTGKVVLVGGFSVNDGNGGHNYNLVYANNTNSSILRDPSAPVTTPAQTVNDVIASVNYARSPFILPQSDKITAKNAIVLNAMVEIAPVTSVFEVQPVISYDQVLPSSEDR
jgi:filamentous hemagglutinin family protein